VSPAAVAVGRLRVEDVRRDPLATRGALDRALAGADLRPRGLPPAAILVVRTLRDPLPRRLTLDRGGMGPPPEWEHAVAAALDELARGAARPAHDAVPANADAVLFADRAELLACLLRDRAAGAVASRWWWRLVVPGDAEARVPAALRASPTYVPAALGLLAERGEAVSAVAAIPPREAHALAAAVAAAFGAPFPAAGGGEEATSAGAEPGRAPPPEPATRPPGAPSDAAATPPPAPDLLRGVPEARAPGLRAEQRALLALALTLRRAPAAAMTPVAPGGVRVAGARRRPPPDAGPAPAAEPGLARERAVSGAPPPFGVPPALRRDAPAEPGPAREPGPAEPEPAPAPRDERAAGPPRPRSPAAGRPPAPPAGPPAVAAEPATRGPEEATAPRQPPPRPARPVPSSPSPAAPGPDREARPAPRPRRTPVPPGAGMEDGPEPALPRLLGPAVETELGGLFFLVNAGIDLGLYGDFTQPAHPGIELDLWDFLTLAGRELLGGDGDDPVWTLLAELAGREPDSPAGDGFHPPGGVTVTAWTRSVAEEIRGRLASAELSAERLLRRAALVHVTEAHVDVVFALAGHPLEVRVAGLDRDPGFVPAAGRHLAFHFE
jgi:hypothetical protein